MALIITLESALFLAKGNLGLSPEVIATLASTGWSYNLDIAKSLATQSSDTWVGVILLLLAFGLQMGNTLWPMVIDDYNGVDWVGLGVALMVSLIVLIGGYFGSRSMANYTYNKVFKILSSPTPSRGR